MALGATAGRALLRREVTVQRERGAVLRLEEGRSMLLTVHPSYLLRLPDPTAKAAEYDRFVTDLKLATSFATAP